MRILVIGGTRFVGRHIVEAALAAGHDVTLLHRGTGADLFPELEHLHVDRDASLDLLTDCSFDATVDTSAYFPRQVSAVADAMGERAGRYLVISSTSVYARPAGPGFDESSPTVEPAADDVTEVTETTYGPLKVAIENVARERFGARATVVRPTYVIGPYDHTERFTYWVERIAEGGEVLAPGNPRDPIQVIDARDMAAWIVRLLENDVAGTFHAVSPDAGFCFRDMLDVIREEVAPEGTWFTWADQQWLLDQGENGSTLPLWGEDDPWIEANAADPEAAQATGLDPRFLPASIRAVLTYAEQHPDRSRGPAITRSRESELLAAWHAR